MQMQEMQEMQILLQPSINFSHGKVWKTPAKPATPATIPCFSAEVIDCRQKAWVLCRTNCLAHKDEVVQGMTVIKATLKRNRKEGI